MPISSKTIAQKLNQSHPDSVKVVLWEMLIESLSPQQKKAYACILAGHTLNTEIANIMGVGLTHVANLTKDLYDFGLVSRQEVVNESGRWYVYHLPQNGHSPQGEADDN